MGSVTTLPDYPAIQQLAGALYREAGKPGRAAIMVGAGFSRCAAVTGDPGQKLPLWDELATQMVAELGANKTASALQLAEEYQANFGRHALLALVRSAINDTAWRPGLLYRDLLSLPWADVLTTNWDTLLERATDDVHEPVYSVVNRPADLAAMAPPRIVKLHGTLHVTQDVVFTEEDYRTYPQRCAAFVNLARQVFIENELCLIGFSGDDPNFLQWVGWVRDQLDSHARRIYLAGNLNLTRARRQYLQSINIVPIDLHPLVDTQDADRQHTQAVERFVAELHRLQPASPWAWRPTEQIPRLDDAAHDNADEKAAWQANELARQVPILRQDREAYPGWLVCPHDIRSQLLNQVDYFLLNKDSLDAMEERHREPLLYEIAWRHQTTFRPLGNWLAEYMLAVCRAPASDCLTHWQQCDMTIAVLKSMRMRNTEQSKALASQAEALVQQRAADWPRGEVELQYARAFVACEQLDYAKLSTLMDGLSATQPVWQLRKAMLLAELGRLNDSCQMVGQAFQTLSKQHHNDPRSLYVLSRLAWAHWLKQAMDQAAGEHVDNSVFHYYQQQKCSPWDEIEHLRTTVNEQLAERRESETIQPLFAAGRFRDNSKTVRFTSAPPALVQVKGIAHETGTPLRWGMMHFLAKEAGQAVLLEQPASETWLAWVVRAASADEDKLLEGALSRCQVACLPLALVDAGVRQCREAIDYWRGQTNLQRQDEIRYRNSRLSVVVEVLARLSVRLSPQSAKAQFRLAAQLCHASGMRPPGLWKALQHLLNYALSAIPVDEQPELLADALYLPLATEIGIGPDRDWPNAIIKMPGERPVDTAIDRRIRALIDSIMPESPRSEAALMRLLPLVEAGFLTTEERQTLEKALWGSVPDYETLPDVGLLAWVFVKKLSLEPECVKKRVQEYLYAEFEERSDNLFYLLDVAHSAAELSLYPAQNQARALFDLLTAWRFPDTDILVLSLSQHEEKVSLAGRILATAIIPALPVDALDGTHYRQLSAFMEETGNATALPGLVYFALENEDWEEETAKYILSRFQHREAGHVSAAARAVLLWRQKQPSSATATLLTKRLIYAISAGQRTGLVGLLTAALQLLKEGSLDETECEILAESLPAVFDNANYVQANNQSYEAVDAPPLRAACAQLAVVLAQNSRVTPVAQQAMAALVQQATEDRLPEVRFAAR